MILEPKKTTVAYRCPECGAGVLSVVDIFALSANRVKLKCDCGKSEMDVVIQSDDKIRLTVPCIFCRKPHVFTVNKQIFYGRDLFVLPPVLGYKHLLHGGLQPREGGGRQERA